MGHEDWQPVGPEQHSWSIASFVHCVLHYAGHRPLLGD